MGEIGDCSYEIEELVTLFSTILYLSHSEASMVREGLLFKNPFLPELLADPFSSSRIYLNLSSEYLYSRAIAVESELNLLTFLMRHYSIYRVESRTLKRKILRIS